MPVTRINQFQAAAGKAEELYAFLKSLEPFITSSAGCTRCEVLQSSEQPDHFVVIEKWESVAAHKKALDNFPKAEMQAAFELFAAPPKGEYYLG